jgi:DNA invertase Pin-like site-specific DNA recombinase
MSMTVRGYGRASTDAQILSTDQQHAKVRDAFAAFKTITSNWGDAVWGGFLADEATSRVSSFRERHFGSLLLAASQPGDIILVSNYDRIFASVVDVCESLELLSRMKVGLVILDTDLDTTTIIGDFCFKILALVKEMEVKEIRRRTRESIAHRKRLGRPMTAPPVGWKHKAVQVPGVPKAQRYLVPDERARRYARKLAGIMLQGRYNFRQAAYYCNSEGFMQLNGKRWTEPTFAKWMRAAQADFPLPNGSHEAFPIPADAVPVNVETISADD